MYETVAPGISYAWSNMTPRYTHVKDAGHLVFLGLQYFIKRYLKKGFNEFFSLDYLADHHIRDYSAFVKSYFGLNEVDVSRWRSLQDLGYLPLEIWALPEGASVPFGVPMFLITNTHPDFAWLPNHFESLLSNIIWGPSTSATTAQRYRRLFEKHARESGETDFSPIDYMGHDFSMRGLMGVEAASLSGLGHLTAFNGTDTCPAIKLAADYYGASYGCGNSIRATEHSVMCCGGEENELETFRRLLQAPGNIGIVSDTWNIWRVLREYIPALREQILSREGLLVIRPDSGDPVKIVCGDAGSEENWCSFYGVTRLLNLALGSSIKPNGLKMLNNAACIYGDSITLERADAICQGLRDAGFSIYNQVFGIGSYTYQHVTRDTYGLAMKMTAVKQAGVTRGISKNPITCDGKTKKKSHCGIPVVYGDGREYPYKAVESLNGDDLNDSAFRLIYSNGELLRETNLTEIRKRARA